MAKKILIILAEGFEEIEAITPIDILRRGNADVTVAALSHEPMVRGRSKVIIDADTTLDQILMKRFDCIILPGGPGTQLMLNDSRIITLLQSHNREKKVIAAICAAPLILDAAGLLMGKKFTAHVSVKDKLPNLLETESTLVDKNIITSRGAGTALDFSLKLVQVLFDKELEAKIKNDIHYLL